MQEIIQMCSYESTKSTRGASKMRRDLINTEIKQLRELLPLPPSTRQRLSQLQLMALVCVYVRKSNYFQQLFKHHEQPLQLTPNLGFSKALNGFILMMTQGGKLLFISDNAAEYLGHSMEDLLIHGDSVFDILDKQDHAAVQAELVRAAQGGSEDDRLFLCRMNVSRNARRQMRFGDQKVVLVHGHFLSYLPLCSRNEPVFLAHCSPVAMPETRESVVQGATNVFTTLHTLDMKILSIDKNGEFYLGYPKSSLIGVSWYHLIHPDNLKEVQTKHRLITSSDQERSCILLLRLQAASGAWRWVHCVLQLKDAQESSNFGVEDTQGSAEQKKEVSETSAEEMTHKIEKAPTESQATVTETPSNTVGPNSNSQSQSMIVATNQVLGEREAALLSANSWLYQYYSMQSKLQYNLAYEAQQRVQSYYPQMMQYHQSDPAVAAYGNPYVASANQVAGYSTAAAPSHYSLASSPAYLQHYHHHYPLRFPHNGYDYSRARYGYTSSEQCTNFTYLPQQTISQQQLQNQHYSENVGMLDSYSATFKNSKKSNYGRPSSRRSSPVNGISTTDVQDTGGVAVAAPVAIRPSLPTQTKGVFQQITEDLELSWKASPIRVVPEYANECTPYVTSPYTKSYAALPHSKDPSSIKVIGVDSPSPDFTDQRVPSVEGCDSIWMTDMHTKLSWIPSGEHSASLRLFH